MKKVLALILVVSSMSVFAESKAKVSIEIKASSEALCQFASDAAFKNGEFEAHLLSTGSYVVSISSCNKGIDGNYRKTVKFSKKKD